MTKKDREYYRKLMKQLDKKYVPLPYKTTLKEFNLEKLPTIYESNENENVLEKNNTSEETQENNNTEEKQTKNKEIKKKENKKVDTTLLKNIIKNINNAYLKLITSHHQKINYHKKISTICSREIKKNFLKTSKSNPFLKCKRLKKEMERIYYTEILKSNSNLIHNKNLPINKNQKTPKTINTRIIRKKEREDNIKKEKEEAQQHLNELIEKSQKYSNYIENMYNLEDTEDNKIVNVELSNKIINISTTDIRKIDNNNIYINMDTKLAPHQKEGLNWLITLYNHGLNGILADDMGLGKTCQSLALLSYITLHKNFLGPFLIIAPSSTLHNWSNEIKKFVPYFEIIEYFGEKRKEKIKKLKRYISKYNSNKNIFNNSIDSLLKNKRNTLKPQILIVSYTIAVTDIEILKNIIWCYIVVDEAQSIKSSTSARWNTLMRLKTQKNINLNKNTEDFNLIEESLNYKISNKTNDKINDVVEVGGKLLLTGTPIQNSLSELWSLLHFVMPKVFSSKDMFLDWFAKSEQNSNTKILDNLNTTQQLEKLENLDNINNTEDVNNMENPKRIKNSVKNTGIQLFSKSMINKLKEILKPFMLRREKKDILKTLPPKTKINVELEMSGEQFEIYHKILNGVYDFDIDNNINITQYIDDNINIYDTNVNDGEARKNLQIHLRKACNHPFLMESKTLETPFFFSRYNYFYDSTKAIENKIDYDKLDEILNNSDSSDVEFNYKIKDENEYEIYGDRNNVLHEFNITKYIPDIKINANKLNINANKIESITKSYKFEDMYRFNHEKIVKMPLFFNDTKYIQNYKLNIKNLTSFPFPKLQDIVAKSCKMVYLAKLLPDLLFSNKKCLIFFQMTKMIDIFEYFCQNYKICLPNEILKEIQEKYPNKKIPDSLTFKRLDGSDTLHNRKILVESFSDDSSIFLFLLSTRAAGVGINLTAADTVIFYDRDWNPTVDMQAEDRVHRIGQTKPVSVYKFVIKDSIEEIVEDTGERKGEMMKNVLIKE